MSSGCGHLWLSCSSIFVIYSESTTRVVKMKWVVICLRPSRGRGERAFGGVWAECIVLQVGIAMVVAFVERFLPSIQHHSAGAGNHLRRHQRHLHTHHHGDNGSDKCWTSVLAGTRRINMLPDHASKHSSHLHFALRFMPCLSSMLPAPCNSVHQ